MKKFFRSSGFTLIELLVVIAILGILAVTILATINPVTQLQKSTDAHRKADLESIQRALELYYQDNGSYPASSSNYEIFVGGFPVAWGTSWKPYMSTLPKDPSSTDRYVYYSPPSSGGQSYYLYATLQRGKDDQDACNSGNACTSIQNGGSGFPGATACGGTCNYGVSSPNVSP